MKTNAQTIKEKYDEKYGLIQQQLAILNKKLSLHRWEQGQHPDNWGYSGDLDRILTDLEDMNLFLAMQS